VSKATIQLPRLGWSSIAASIHCSSLNVQQLLLQHQLFATACATTDITAACTDAVQRCVPATPNAAAAVKPVHQSELCCCCRTKEAKAGAPQRSQALSQPLTLLIEQPTLLSKPDEPPPRFHSSSCPASCTDLLTAPGPASSCCCSA
jgi:hypothetical protein